MHLPQHTTLAVLLLAAPALAQDWSNLGGNAAQVERALGLSGDQILYVGDHLFADVHVSKALLRWRTALILREDDDVELVKMAVTPAFRGRGIGRLLTLHAIDRAKALGFRFLPKPVNAPRLRALVMADTRIVADIRDAG